MKEDTTLIETVDTSGDITCSDALTSDIEAHEFEKLIAEETERGRKLREIDEENEWIATAPKMTKRSRTKIKFFFLGLIGFAFLLCTVNFAFSQDAEGSKLSLASVSDEKDFGVPCTQAFTKLRGLLDNHIFLEYENGREFPLSFEMEGDLTKPNIYLHNATTGDKIHLQKDTIVENILSLMRGSYIQRTNGSNVKANIKDIHKDQKKTYLDEVETYSNALETILLFHGSIGVPCEVWKKDKFKSRVWVRTRNSRIIVNERRMRLKFDRVTQTKENWITLQFSGKTNKKLFFKQFENKKLIFKQFENFKLGMEGAAIVAAEFGRVCMKG